MNLVAQPLFARLDLARTDTLEGGERTALPGAHTRHRGPVAFDDCRGVFEPVGARSSRFASLFLEQSLYRTDNVLRETLSRSWVRHKCQPESCSDQKESLPNLRWLAPLAVKILIANFDY